MNKLERKAMHKKAEAQTLELINVMSKDNLVKEFKNIIFSGSLKNKLGKKTYSEQLKLDRKSRRKEATMIQLAHKYGTNIEMAKAALN